MSSNLRPPKRVDVFVHPDYACDVGRDPNPGVLTYLKAMASVVQATIGDPCRRAVVLSCPARPIGAHPVAKENMMGDGVLNLTTKIGCGILGDLELADYKSATRGVPDIVVHGSYLEYCVGQFLHDIAEAEAKVNRARLSLGHVLPYRDSDKILSNKAAKTFIVGLNEIYSPSPNLCSEETTIYPSGRYTDPSREFEIY